MFKDCVSFFALKFEVVQVSNKYFGLSNPERSGDFDVRIGRCFWEEKGVF